MKRIEENDNDKGKKRCVRKEGKIGGKRKKEKEKVRGVGV